MIEPSFSVRLGPMPGASLVYTGETVALNVTIENTSPTALSLPLEKVRHNGLFVKYQDARDPDQFAYAARCPGCDSPAERDERLTTIEPGGSVSFERTIDPGDLEQFRGPEDVDILCELTVRARARVDDEWRDLRATAAARIQGRRALP